jgi:hypothetical protein
MGECQMTQGMSRSRRRPFKFAQSKADEASKSQWIVGRSVAVIAPYEKSNLNLFKTVVNIHELTSQWILDLVDLHPYHRPATPSNRSHISSFPWRNQTVYCAVT